MAPPRGKLKETPAWVMWLIWGSIAAYALAAWTGHLDGDEDREYDPDAERPIEWIAYR